jgi:hypothetical protein
MSLDIEAGIGSCIGAAGADVACGAGREAAMVAAIEVAIVVPLSGTMRRGLELISHRSLISFIIHRWLPHGLPVYTSSSPWIPSSFYLKSLSVNHSLASPHLIYSSSARQDMLSAHSPLSQTAFICSSSPPSPFLEFHELTLSFSDVVSLVIALYAIKVSSFPRSTSPNPANLR